MQPSTSTSVTSVGAGKQCWAAVVDGKLWHWNDSYGPQAIAAPSPAQFVLVAVGGNTVIASTGTSPPLC